MYKRITDAIPVQELELIRPRLIDRCQRLYDFIIQYKLAHDGNSPTYREVMAEVDGITSSSMVMFYLRKLEEFGVIKWSDSDGTSRRIQVIGGSWSFKI